MVEKGKGDSGGRAVEGRWRSRARDRGGMLWGEGRGWERGARREIGVMAEGGKIEEHA